MRSVFGVYVSLNLLIILAVVFYLDKVTGDGSVRVLNVRRSVAGDFSIEGSAQSH